MTSRNFGQSARRELSQPLGELDSFEVAGVDGCKAGWFVAISEAAKDQPAPDSCWEFELKRVFVSATFAHVLAETAGCESVCVDIPIGLSNGSAPRQCDVQARRLLGPGRASSVFPAPIRACLSATDYSTANTASRQVSGKGITRQSFAILPKIREVDELMDPFVQRRVREIHPEICFWALAGGSPMQKNKKTVPGQAERRRLLQKVFPNLDDVLASAPVRGYVLDDAYDAAVAAWTAGQEVVVKAASLPKDPPLDDRGLRMEMVYPLA